MNTHHLHYQVRLQGISQDGIIYFFAAGALAAAAGAAFAAAGAVAGAAAALAATGVSSTTALVVRTPTMMLLGESRKVTPSTAKSLTRIESPIISLSTVRSMLSGNLA